MTSMKLLLATTAIAGIAALGATGASAQTLNTCSTTNNPNFTTCIAGGGSTLAAPTYLTVLPNADNQDNTLGFNYLGKGSGPSQCAFLTNTTSAFNAPGQEVDFSASDAAISSSQVASYNGGTGTCNTTTAAGAAVVASFANGFGRSSAGNLIQIPSFGTPITMAFNFPGGSRINQPNSFQLTDDQICGIFSGKITDFSQLTGTTVGGGTRPPRLPTGTITVAYRSDGSGTSFLFTNHLGQVCTPANSNFFNAGFPNAGNTTFGGTTTFASLFPVGGIPANFVGGSGSPGVQTVIETSTTPIVNPPPPPAPQTTPNNVIGYLSPDYTAVATSGTLTPGVPAFPNVANVFNRNNGVAYAPTVSNTQTALAADLSARLASTFNSTAAYANPLNYDPLFPNPSSGYPIVGFTTFDFAQCYKNANVGFGVITAVLELYTGNLSAVTIASNGFSPPPPALVNIINNNILNPGPNGPTDIENTSVCQSNGAPVNANTFVGR